MNVTFRPGQEITTCLVANTLAFFTIELTLRRSTDPELSDNLDNVLGHGCRCCDWQGNASSGHVNSIQL